VNRTPAYVLVDLVVDGAAEHIGDGHIHGWDGHVHVILPGPRERVKHHHRHGVALGKLRSEVEHIRGEARVEGVPSNELSKSLGDHGVAIVHSVEEQLQVVLTHKPAEGARDSVVMLHHSLGGPQAIQVLPRVEVAQAILGLHQAEQEIRVPQHTVRRTAHGLKKGSGSEVAGPVAASVVGVRKEILLPVNPRGVGGLDKRGVVGECGVASSGTELARILVDRVNQAILNGAKKKK